MSLEDVSFDERLGPILDELLQMSRLGKQPDLDEYRRQFPELADQIAGLYQTIFLIESDGLPADVNAESYSIQQNQTLKRLGEYRIVREIGRGGMGVVYEAIQESLDRHVALKVLPPSQVLSDEQIRRFQREAKAAGQLRHPNIVGVIDVGEEDGIHFYVMQFINGTPLDQVLHQIRTASTQPSRFAIKATAERSSEVDADRVGEMVVQSDPVDTGNKNSQHSLSSQYDSKARYFRSVARIGFRTAQALDYAHRKGVLHRDIKPANMLLDENDEIWITDFGLAKFGDDDLTRTGDLVGTLRFMPPERLRGWSDPRSDVYSLGLTLYELATLNPAFRTKDRIELLEKINDEAPILPSKIVSEIPEDLETIILTSIAKEPQERYASASMMAEDLEPFLDGRPIRAHRNTIPKRLWLWAKLKPVIASLMGLSFLLLLAVAVISAFSAISLNNRFKEVSAANQIADERLLDAYLTQISASRSSDVPGGRAIALEAIRNAIPLAEKLRPEELYRLRNQAIAVLSKSDIQMGMQFPVKEMGNDRPDAAFDDAIRNMVRINEEGRVEFVDLQNGVRNTPEATPQFSRIYSQLSMSPDGKMAVVGGQTVLGQHTLLGIDRISGTVLFERQGRDLDYLEQSTFSADSSRFAFIELGKSSRSMSSIVIGLRKKNGLFEFRQFETNQTTSVNFSSDGNFVIHSDRNQVNVTDIRTQKTIASLPRKINIQCACFGPNDQSIIVAPVRGPVEFWKLDNGTFTSLNRQVPLGSQQKQIHATAHPRLPIAITTGVDGRTTLWNMNSGEPTFATDFRGIQISSEGNRIGFSNQEDSFGYLNLVTPTAIQLVHLPPTERLISSLDFSEDESRLVAVDSDTNTMTLIDLNTTAIISQKESAASIRRSARFKPGFPNQILDCGLIGGSVGLYSIQNSPGELGFTQSIVQKEQNWKGLALGSMAMQFDADKKRFYFLSDDGFLEIRSWPNSEQLNKIQIPELRYDYLAVSPNGRFASIARKGYMQTLVYDLDSKNMIFRPGLVSRDFRYRQNTGCRSEFSNDSLVFAVATPTEFRFYSTIDWRLITTISRDKIGLGKVAFSDRFIATADYDRINLYSTQNFELLASLETAAPIQFSSDYSDQVPALEFSPSGKYLAAGTMSNRIVVWNLDELGKQLTELGLNWK